MLGKSKVSSAGFIKTKSAFPVMLGLFIIAGMFLLFGSTSTAAERVLVTDPEELAAMGFSADAKNIYKVVPQGTEAAANDNKGEADFFGGSSGFSTAMSRAFQGRTSAYTYSSTGGINIFNTSGGENFADAQVDFPNGATLQFLRSWFIDTNAGANQDLEVFLFEDCQPTLGAGVPVFTTLGSVISSGSPGEGSVAIAFPANTVANTRDCVYTLRARFGPSLGGPGNNTLQLYKARVQWFRTVSPAPAVATFSDVPTGHPFFRFVEALVSTGITAGCGGGNFCVNSPITRGEMAVFLSVALGLDFGGLF